MPLPMPGGGPTVTVEAMLRQPRLLVRQLTDLAAKRFVADQVFTRGSSEQIAGGAALYQRSESIYPERDVSEVMPRSNFPRTGWTEELLAAFAHKYGLEFVVSDEARRRNQIDVIARGQRKLANALVRFVDDVAMDLLINDTAVLNDTATAAWDAGGRDIIGDLSSWIQQIQDQDEGYEPDTLIVHPNQNQQMIVDSNIRDALPREPTTLNAILGGRPVPILGLQSILVSKAVPDGTVIVLQSKVVGTIADEQPLASEEYVTYNPGANAAGVPFAPIFMKVYRENAPDETIVRSMRTAAMWLAEPKAALVATGA